MAKAKIKSPLEDIEQQAVATWISLCAPSLLWTHPPNGGSRHKAVATKLKKQGVSPGVPDIMIFTPAFYQGEPYVGVAIELKRRDAAPSAVKPEQRQWLAGLAEAGWLTSVCRGADECTRLIKEVYQ